MKGKILKLNKHYFPIGIADWREGIKNIFSLAVFPLDVQYNQEQDGQNLENFEWFEPVKEWNDWIKLPIRDYDEYIQTVKGPVRLPTIVLCCEYSAVKWKRVLFPTKHNIWERDRYTCCYSGRRLSREEVTVDHIIPVSKGGENTWLNLVTCAADINRKKGDKSLEDCGFKLISKPFIPKGGMTFPILRPEWTKFIAE